ncbi:hypothetical protein QYE76_049151 [Lolium multiflorum]|uniref:Rx N-terminal domain-containing protein n=1 Tax=Lolium multiflorum TaxID=4521 RepID=A0AAD8SP27_LOLMU|nr:hypothetical protein QYE76_049151 [Lolium multiflorum]
MEVVLSAAAGELVSRIFSFLRNKYSENACSEEKRVERLQQLLLRAHMVVEEADRRYITNSGMLLHLKILSRAMYNGYHAVDTYKCNQLIKEGSKEVTTTDSFASYLGTPLKRFRANSGISVHKVDNSCDLQDALVKLETLVSNMTEFVILLSGCESMMVRRPYDMYLYVDNFMFGRQTEKQQVINFLLQHNPLGSPSVLPIIGGTLVGKKTLVKHVWNDEKVRSYYSSVLHINGDNFCTIDNERTSGRTIVVVTFVSDVDDEKWKSFYRAVTCISTETKIIIVSRMESSARYGTMEPIRLSRLQDEEYNYLFKTLAFGSARAEDNPKLTLLAGEFIKLLGGSFVGAYSFAYTLRTDLRLQFWLSSLNLLKKPMKKNLSLYGENVYPFKQRYPIDLTDFLPSTAAPLHIMPPRTEAEVSERKLPKIRLKDILVNPSLRPMGEFDLVTWESRIPPYTEFCSHVTPCAQQHLKTTLRRKRDATICL